MHGATQPPTVAARGDVLAATDAIRNGLVPVQAVLALLAAGDAADAEALDDARAGLRRVVAAVERLERGQGG